MRPQDIRQFLTKQPFRPFRMTLTDGRAYEIRHPELAMVGRSTVVIGLPPPDDPTPIYEQFVIVSLLRIRQIESAESSESD